MTYDPRKHHCHALRLKNYDYSQPGAYFVTICSWQRQPHFLSPELRETLTTTWQHLSSHYPTATPDAFVVMPDHIHGIIILGEPRKLVRKTTLTDVVSGYKSMTTVAWIRMKKGHHEPYTKHLWQERFYDHGMRNERDLRRIHEYILHNPLNSQLRMGIDIDDDTWEAMVRQHIDSDVL